MPERRGNRARTLVIAVLLVATTAGPAPAFNADYDTAANTILCDCGCHPQSVHDCACGRAAEMRDEIAALVRGGMSGEQIIARYVEEKGDQVRIAPTASGFNLVAWLGPLLLLAAASVALVLMLRRWRRSGPDGGDEDHQPAPPTVDPDDPYLDRLRRDVERQS